VTELLEYRLLDRVKQLAFRNHLWVFYLLRRRDCSAPKGSIFLQRVGVKIDDVRSTHPLTSE
jgi:hypothetical protein